MRESLTNRGRTPGNLFAGSARRQALAADGVWVEGYLPLFTYLAGLDGARAGAAAGRQCAAMLASERTFRVHACPESLCRRPDSTAIWGALGEELGRIPRDAVREVHCFTPSSPEVHAQVMLTRLEMKCVNMLFAKIFPGKLKPVFYQCIIAIRLGEGDATRDVYFGIAPEEKELKMELGLDPKDIALKFLPEEIQKVHGMYQKTKGIVAPVKTDAQALAAGNAIAEMLARWALATREAQ